MKAVYFICTNRNYGHVSYEVWDVLKDKGYLENRADFDFAGAPVYQYGKDGHCFYFVSTDIALCRDYPRFLPDMNKYFADCDMSGMVTWHEGGNAPDNVLTVHSLGDMGSGIFGKAAPRFMRNLILAYERNRCALGLEDYFVSTEATHWSGSYGADGDPALLVQYPVPMVDIEVGSAPESWENKLACTALANTLTEVFNDDGKKLHNILCVGGVHFESSFSIASKTSWGDEAFAVTHILANQWLVSEGYDAESGFERACNCVDSIEGGIEAIFIHDKLKGCYKDLARKLGEKYRVPVYKHQKLRTPEELF